MRENGLDFIQLSELSEVPFGTSEGLLCLGEEEWQRQK